MDEQYHSQKAVLEAVLDGDDEAAAVMLQALDVHTLQTLCKAGRRLVRYCEHALVIVLAYEALSEDC